MSSDKERHQKIFKKLFPYVKPEHIQNGEYRYMSTGEDSTKTMSLIQLYVKKYGRQQVKNMSIADAFACLGGNTYFFAEAFAHVSAYEIDETRREHLKENIEAFYKRKNVDVYEDCEKDGRDNIFQTYHDVVFLDPPWLNPKTNVVDGFVFEYVYKICESLAESASTTYVFLKLPLMDDHTSSFEALVKRMGDKWRDVLTRSITRRKRGREHPTYTIICARLKPPEVAKVDVNQKKLDVNVLLQQLKIIKSV